jgi:pyruvate,water dikinase
VSSGIVRGRVKILRTPDEKKFEKGEILVARATDPGWTPLFVNAAGVILEVGGLLQHGALVAREYGLPCVAGIERATSLWKDGTLVEVDGSSGIVRLIRE